MFNPYGVSGAVIIAEYDNVDESDGGGNNNDANVFMVGTQISF
jgi:hypothetical protein